MSRLIYPRPSRRTVTIPPDARWAMEAVHRVRAALAERRTVYAVMHTDDYNRTYCDGAMACLGVIERALEGRQ